MLVRIHAATVNRLDCHTRDANRSNGVAMSVLSRMVSGSLRPRQPILRSEFAWVVEAVGSAVREFTHGDHVFGNTGLGLGCHPEYRCVGESSNAGPMPVGDSFAEAARSPTAPSTRSGACARPTRGLGERSSPMGRPAPSAPPACSSAGNLGAE